MQKIVIILLTCLLTTLCASAQTYTWYQDLDGDGWGNPLVSQVAATQPTGYVLNSLDCDDGSVNGNTWVFMDGQRLSDSTGVGANKFDIVFDKNSNPTIGFTASSIYTYYIMRWNGTMFEKLPPLLTQSIVHAQHLDLAMSQNDTLYALYPDPSLFGRLTLKKFNGTSWVVVGNPGFSNSSVRRGKVEFYNNIPFVVFEDNDSNPHGLTVMTFNGATWVNVGARKFITNTGNDYYREIEMEINRNGSIHVFVTEGDNKGEDMAYVMQYGSASWYQVGPKIAVPRFDKSAAFNLDNNGIPNILYIDTAIAHKNRPTLKKLNGSSWVTVGKAGFSDSTSYGNAHLGFDMQGRAYAMYSNDKYAASWMEMSIFDGNNWSQLGDTTVNFSSIGANYIDMGMAPNGIPHAIFWNYDKPHRVGVRRLAPKGGGGATGPTMPTATATPDTITVGDSSVLKVTTGMLNDATNWIWYTGSCGGTRVTPSSSNTDGSTVAFKPTTTTTYYVRGEGGCLPAGVCDSITVVVKTTSINTIANTQAKLSLYPNPNNGVFTVKGIFANGKEAIITVMNSIGQKVYRSTISINNSELNHELTMPQNASQGIYLLSIEVDGQVYHKRFDVFE